MFMLGEITSSVKGIEKHLETQNGRIKTNESKIDELETYRDEQRGVARIHGWIAGIGGSIITALVLRYFK